MSAALSETTIGHLLIAETEALCRPPDYIGRGKVGELCTQHGYYHTIHIYRHCDGEGNIIHLNVSKVQASQVKC